MRQKGYIVPLLAVLAGGAVAAVLASLEGAFVLARALRSTEPLRLAGAQSAAAVRDALP